MMTIEGNTMKRFLKLAAVLTLVLCFIATGCANDQKENADIQKITVPDKLAGAWECEDLASDGKTDTSFYTLEISEDGYFTLYDFAAGNPGISGQIVGLSKGEIELAPNTEDFYPPFCWDMNEANTVTLRYSVGTDSLSLEYDGIALGFTRL